MRWKLTPDGTRGRRLHDLHDLAARLQASYIRHGPRNAPSANIPTHYVRHGVAVGKAIVVGSPSVAVGDYSLAQANCPYLPQKHLSPHVLT